MTQIAAAPDVEILSARIYVILLRIIGPARKHIHPDGFRRLALAVIVQGAKDANTPPAGDEPPDTQDEARRWLMEEGEEWITAAGLGAQVDAADLVNWISTGCPGWKMLQRS